ncbi:phosphonoacetaldehyde hydrolase [Rubinisphaera italica]|uniref:phosphonoacetaldehyde hydrolase n=1 Tax=Rubinisphaera italica TaxID=2527969 RepID=A0A5C5XIV2_9PLAN|nr:phosphonoacetaldehyde hydrolase [Rubinisphaera italica]TWT61762.1 Phosphonoacetaldehyde hydrolase [Rubinisphaera italica]
MNSERSQVRLVVFDWAGTTVDFGSRAPATAFRKVFEAHSVMVTDDEARKPMGLNKREHLKSMLSEADIAKRWEEQHGNCWTEADVDQMYADFVPFQLQAIKETTKLVPGLTETVDQLRSQGIVIGGTTGYFREAAEAVATTAEAAGFVPEANVCADDVLQGRPAPWMIYEIMHQARVYPATCVVKVGDTIADIEAGLNAGCWSIGVCDSSSMTGLSHEEYSQLSAEERTTRLQQTAEQFLDAGAHAVIETLSDLPELIASINQQLIQNSQPCVISQTAIEMTSN